MRYAVYTLKDDTHELFEMSTDGDEAQERQYAEREMREPGTHVKDLTFQDLTEEEILSLQQ